MDDEHLTGFGAVYVDTAARRVAGPQLLPQRLSVRVVVEPWTAVELRLYLELLAWAYVQRRLVVGPSLEVEDVCCGSLHIPFLTGTSSGDDDVYQQAPWGRR